MQYRPARTPGLLAGGLLTGWALAAALLLFAIGVGRELGFEGWLAYSASLVAAVIAVLFGYWTWALWTLSYDLDRNALLIRWGWTQQVIPLGSIERLVPASAVAIPSPGGVSWWGSQIGRAIVEPIGPVLCYASGRLPEQLVYVVTPRQTYALTIADPQEFAREVLVRQELGPTARLQHQARRSGPPLLRAGDRVALLIALGAVLGGAAVWLQIALRHSAVPATVPLHLTAGEAADFIARPALIEMGSAATGILIAGLVIGVLVHARERVAGRLVFAAAAIVQVIFLAATAIAIG